MGDFGRGGNTNATGASPLAAVSQDIDWYSKGQQRIVEANGVRVVVRLVDRRGRRGRIAITAPPGAVFRDSGLS